MTDSYEVNPRPRSDVIRDMRALARRGTTVRELDALVRGRLGYAPESIIGVIWYFKHAFCLPLGTVLPLQGWCGSDEDEQIDSLLLPAIMSTQAQWANEDLRSDDGKAGEHHKLAATEQRS
jgi:hypothetical protein